MKSILKKGKSIKLTRYRAKCRSFFAIPLFTYASISDEDKINFQGITLIAEDTSFNFGLLDNPEIVTGDSLQSLSPLLSEGVLKDIPTGDDANTYIYQEVEDQHKVEENIIDEFAEYEQLLKNSHPKKIPKDDEVFDDEDVITFTSFEDYENEIYAFRHCMLAQSNPFGGDETEVIITFKGYLELSSPFGILRKGEYDSSSSSINEVYIPEYFINKYKLRNGDQIICTCVDNGEGKKVLDALLSINEVSHFNWNSFRDKYNDLPHIKQNKAIACHGEYMDIVCKEFGLQRGENTFVYVDKNTDKSLFISKLVNELITGFDKVIYINPTLNPYKNQVDNINVVKFCTKFDESFNTQARIALLGINYAKRLVELGKNVAVVVDDFNSVSLLDKDFNGEMPITKTVFGSAKDSEQGALSLFTIIPTFMPNIPFRAEIIFKNLETLELVIDNNEFDLFNSYRIKE